jgi:hypothetical protein
MNIVAIDIALRTNLAGWVSTRIRHFVERHGSPLSLVCWWRGHEYPMALCPGYCIYFCARCGKELCGRTLEQIDELPPIPDDLREQLDQLEGWD